MRQVRAGSFFLSRIRTNGLLLNIHVLLALNAAARGSARANKYTYKGWAAGPPKYQVCRLTLVFVLFPHTRADNEDACRVVAIILYYALISSFAWLLAEGYHLHHTVRYTWAVFSHCFLALQYPAHPCDFIGFYFHACVCECKLTCFLLYLYTPP